MIDTQARISRSAGPLDRLRVEMAAAGVGRAVLYPADPSVSAEYLAELRDRHPRTFAIAGQLDPLSPFALAAAEELRVRWDVAGMELKASDPKRRWLNATEVMPLWEELESLAVPIDVCIASQDYNQFSDVVTTFPSLRVVLRDLGWGPNTAVSQYVPVLLEYARYPQVMVSISRLFAVSGQPHPHTDIWPVLEQIYRSFGGRRLVWAAGYPGVLQSCGYQAEAALLEQLPFLDPVDVGMIAETNAARLWFESSLQVTDNG